MFMKSLQLFFLALLLGLFIGCEPNLCEDVECSQLTPENPSVLCFNGEFANGGCNCFEGYEGIKCETEIRDRFLGGWDVDEWTSASQIGGSPVHGFLPGAIRLKEGYNILEVELYTTDRNSGLMLVSSDNRIVGQVTENKINFEYQQTHQGTFYGSASLDDRILSIELYLFNPNTSLTEEARGTFTKH